MHLPGAADLHAYYKSYVPVRLLSMNVLYHPVLCVTTCSQPLRHPRTELSTPPHTNESRCEVEPGFIQDDEIKSSHHPRNLKIAVSS